MLIRFTQLNKLQLLGIVLIGTVFTIESTELQLKNGSVFKGEIIADNGTFLTLKTTTSTLSINKSLLLKIDGVSFENYESANKLQKSPPFHSPSQSSKIINDTKSEKKTIQKKVWVVTLHNGSTFRGEKLSENERVLVLNANGSPVSIFKNVIASIDSGSNPQANISPRNHKVNVLTLNNSRLQAGSDALQEADERESDKTEQIQKERSSLPLPKSHPDLAPKPEKKEISVVKQNSETVNKEAGSINSNETAQLPKKTPQGSVIPAPRKPLSPVSANTVQAGAHPLPAAKAAVQKVKPISPVSSVAITPVPKSEKNVSKAPVEPVRTASATHPKRKQVQSTLPVPVAAPKKREPRLDGKIELRLKDGTVFIGNIASETDHVIVFSSEGASITIFKQLIESVGGEPYKYVNPVDSKSFSKKSESKGTFKKKEKKKNTINVFFRSLPIVDLAEGISIDALIDSINNKSDWKIRSRAARNIGAMGEWGASAIPELLVLLKDTIHQNNAIPAWIDSVSSKNVLSPALEAARSLSQLGTQGETELLTIFEKSETILRCYAVFGLGYCENDETQKTVVKALKDSDPKIRRVALSSLRVNSSFPQLLAALKDPDISVKSTALLLLGKLGNRSAVKQIAAMADDNSRIVRRSVADALGAIGSLEGVSACVTLTKDSDRFVRAEAVRSLGRIKEGNVVQPLINALKDSNADVRATAAEALGFLRDSRSIPSLYALLKDKNNLVREKAHQAIKLHTELPLLIAALDDDSPMVRTNVAYVLWLMTGQDNGQDKEKWEAWAAKKDQVESKK